MDFVVFGASEHLNSNPQRRPRRSKSRSSSAPRCALLVGGADGWDDATRQKADLLWALGSLTLQHELALLVALEQIYRAATIKAGTPYHRE